MWNAEFKPGAITTASLEAEFRPEPDPLSPKENLEAIVSILAIGVLRWRARNERLPERCRENGEESPNMSGIRTCFLGQPERSCLTNASSSVHERSCP